MSYHSYKHKSGGYYRGRSRGGRYYTRSGCLIPMVIIILLITGSLIFFIN